MVETCYLKAGHKDPDFSEQQFIDCNHAPHHNHTGCDGNIAYDRNINWLKFGKKKGGGGMTHRKCLIGRCVEFYYILSMHHFLL